MGGLPAGYNPNVPSNPIPNTTPNREAPGGYSYLPVAPSQGTTLYNDYVQAAGDSYALNAAMVGAHQSPAVIDALQTQYDQDLAKYKADLNAALAASTTAPTLDVWAQSQLSNFGSSWGEPTFASASNSTSSMAGTIDGSGFPGGDQGAAYFGSQNLPKGYVDPPALPANADPSAISTVCANLTPAQAAYAGWAMAQMAANPGKQLEIPDGDVQSWNQIIDWEAQNNKQIDGSLPDPDTSQVGDPDTEVAAAMAGNIPTDVAKIVGEAVGGVFGMIAGFIAPVLAPAVEAAELGAEAGEIGAETAAEAGADAGIDAGENAAATEAGLNPSEVEPSIKTAADEALTAAQNAAKANPNQSRYVGNESYLNDPDQQPAPADAMTGATYKTVPGRSLYGDSGQPSPADVMQNNTSDCGGAAALRQLAEQDPKAISDRIQQTATGQYSVKVGDTWVSVDDEVPVGANGQQMSWGDNSQALWPSLIEKAVAKYRNFMGEGPSQGSQEGLNGLSGIFPQDFIREFLGENSQNAITEARIPSAGGMQSSDPWTSVANGGKPIGSPNLSLQDIENQLTDWTEGSKGSSDMAFVSVGANDQGLTPGHWYSVTGIDQNTGMVTLQNPWGTGAGGEGDGVEQISLADLYCDMNFISFT